MLALKARDGERWMHVGGSGDGGVDGLAFARGRCIAGLTCKLKRRADPAALGKDLHAKLVSAWGAPVRVVVAWLTGPTVGSARQPGVEFLDGLAVAQRLVEHRHHAPSRAW